MKQRLASLIAAVLLAASPGLAAPAANVEAQAAELLSAVEDRRQSQQTSGSTTLDAAFERALAQFARDAQSLSDDLRVTGPEDLACIYNGIAEDAARQLVALKTGGDAADAYRRLTSLLMDARDFAPDAAPSMSSAQAQNDSAGIPCEADPGAVDAYLAKLIGG